MILFVLNTSLILIVAVVIVIAITGNFKVGMRFLDELAQRIRFLRLEKMLIKRNIGS
jgi:hypothetical protein